MPSGAAAAPRSGARAGRCRTRGTCTSRSGGPASWGWSRAACRRMRNPRPRRRRQLLSCSAAATAMAAAAAAGGAAAERRSGHTRRTYLPVVGRPVVGRPVLSWRELCKAACARPAKGRRAPRVRALLRAQKVAQSAGLQKLWHARFARSPWRFGVQASGSADGRACTTAGVPRSCTGATPAGRERPEAAAPVGAWLRRASMRAIAASILRLAECTGGGERAALLAQKPHDLHLQRWQ